MILIRTQSDISHVKCVLLLKMASLLNNIELYMYVCVFVCVCMTQCVCGFVRVFREQLTGVISLLPLNRFQGSSTGCQSSK